MNLPIKCLGSELQLADVVRLWDDGPWADAIVHRIEEHVVHLRRPYMDHGDFSHTGGVITTIGLEDFSVSKTGQFVLVRRGPPLK